MVLKATSVMFTSQLLVTLILFFRNILVARLISVEDFGIASTFAILFAVIETLGNISLNKLIVQDADGEDPAFQGTLHATQLIRGLIATGLTLALAAPYAQFMKTPEVIWAYQCLAIIPFARGFLHLDMFRLQRQMNFMPFAITIVIAPTVSLVVVALVWLVRPDYQVMLWAIIVQQLLQVVLSHVLAERRFALAWAWPFVKRTFTFGGPLLLNGLVFLIVTQGERLIVGNQLDLTILAWFSAAFLLATAPTRILINTTQSLFLPKLSAVREDRDAFAGMALLAIEITLWLGLLAAAAIALMGPLLLVGLFGERYAPGLSVLVMLGAGQAVRIARAAPNAIAMAAGRTSALLYSGLVRALGLPVAWWALMQGHGILVMAAIVLVFELLALAYGLWLAARVAPVPLRKAIPGFAAFGVVIALVLFDLQRSPPTSDILGNLHGFQAVIALAAIGAVAAMPRIRRDGLSLLRRRRKAT